MKIAVLGILAQKISTNSLGGTEMFTANLVNELSKRGHKVTLFATKDSSVNAGMRGNLDSKFFCEVPKNISKIRRSIVMHLSLFNDFLKCQKDFDFVHISTAEWYSYLPFLKFLKIPHCITIHNKELANEDLEFLFSKYPEANFVFTQYSQVESFPKVKNPIVIHHGIRVEDYIYNFEPVEYLSWIGRLVPKKGLEFFPEIQKYTKKEIVFGGGGEECNFFLNEIKPKIKNNSKIKFLGPLDFKKKVELMSNSYVFINPRIMNQKGGMAGLIIVEANSCGTPVVAFDSQAMREIIKDGINGFLVKNENIKDFCKIINNIFSLSTEEYKKLRKNCRKYAEDNFQVKQMVDKYEKLYDQLKEEINAKN